MNRRLVLEILVGMGLLKPIFNWLEKKFLFKAYVISHNYYLELNSKLYFRYLVEHVEYDLEHENKYLSNKKVPMSKLYIQSF